MLRSAEGTRIAMAVVTRDMNVWKWLDGRVSTSRSQYFAIKEARTLGVQKPSVFGPLVKVFVRRYYARSAGQPALRLLMCVCEDFCVLLSFMNGDVLMFFKERDCAVFIRYILADVRISHTELSLANALIASLYKYPLTRQGLWLFLSPLRVLAMLISCYRFEVWGLSVAVRAICHCSHTVRRVEG
jgi:hypothetical protein